MKVSEYIKNTEYTYKQTDLNVVLQFQNEDEQDRTRIILKTGYPTETVQTCLSRLCSEDILERRQADNGRFVYKKTKNALFFNEREYKIINYMYQKHSALIRPNAFLLLAIILVEGSYDIDELIEKRGYKRSSVYNASGKLKENLIIQKNNHKYSFHPDFIESVNDYYSSSSNSGTQNLLIKDWKKILNDIANAENFNQAKNMLEEKYGFDANQTDEILNLKIQSLIAANHQDNN